MNTRPSLWGLLSSIWRGHGDLLAPGVAVALLWELWEAIVIWRGWEK